jgi:hypothetical protein
MIKNLLNLSITGAPISVTLLAVILVVLLQLFLISSPCFLMVLKVDSGIRMEQAVNHAFFVFITLNHL